MFKCLVTTSNHLSEAVFCTFLLVVSGTHCKSDDSCSLHTYRRVLFESHSLMQQRLIMIMLPLKCKSFFSLVHCGETNSNASWKYLSIQQRLATVSSTKKKLWSLTIHLHWAKTNAHFPPPLLLLNMNTELWAHLELMSLSFFHRYKRALTDSSHSTKSKAK